MRNVILCGDVIDKLKTIPDEYVDMCVTSPPYWGLRSYDEHAVTIDPKLYAETRKWLESELAKRGIHAR